MKLCLTLSLALLMLAQPALAQGPYHRSNPEDQVARTLVVESTDPIIYACDSYWATSCFRIVLRINANQSDTVDVGHIPIRGERRATAFSGTGVSCRESDTEGLPEVTVWSSGRFTWREAPVPVSPGHSTTAMMSFGCDGAVIPGDEINIQFALAVDPDGRAIHTARYSLPGLRIAGSPRGRSR